MAPNLAGDMVREFGLLWSWWRPEDNVGCAFNPTAQSGLGGKGCFEEVDVYVRCDEEEAVDEDCQTMRKKSKQMMTYRQRK